MSATRSDKSELLITDLQTEKLEAKRKEKKKKAISTNTEAAKPLPPEINLDDVIIKTSMLAEDQTELSGLALANKILEEFNKDITQSCFTTSGVRGKQLAPNEFMLGVYNNKPELIGSTGKPIARRIIPKIGDFTKIIRDSFTINNPFYGAKGSYVLNVPKGQYAKAKSGNNYLLYGEGCHVIHDPAFSFNPELNFISQAKNVIQHGTINILYVPAGKIAKIWIGSEPYLLEARKKPYVFNHPLFKLVKCSKKANFFDATSHLIEHGSIKRIMPRTSEAAIVYNGGELDVVTADDAKQKPILIDDNNFKVVGFLNTAVQTIVFPSDKDKKMQLLNGDTKTAASASAPKKKIKAKAAAKAKAVGETTFKGEHYKTFRTSDSLLVGVKLLVAYRVTDPKIALTALKSEEEIVKFIKKTATTDIGRAIQKCSSQEFLSSKRNSPKSEQPENLLTGEKQPRTYHDEIKEALANDLKKYGIELVRFNIEKSAIMDVDVGRAMEAQAVESAKTNATAANLDVNVKNAIANAEKDARLQETVQKQSNDATKSKADAEAYAVKAKADADAYAIQKRGEAYSHNPRIFELDSIQTVCKALPKAKMSVTSAEFANMLTNPNTFFGLSARTAVDKKKTTERSADVSASASHQPNQ